MSIASAMVSNYLIRSHPLLLLPSVFRSIRVFSNELTLHIRWPKYWSFSFSISPFKEYSGLISFRMDWLDLLAVEGTLRGLLQHHGFHTLTSLWSNFHTHTWLVEKTIALTFVSKVMSLLFNMLSSFVIDFLPRSKCLLISRLQSPSTVTLEPKKIVCHCFHYFPIYLPWNAGTRCHDLSLLNVEFQASFFTLLFYPHQEVLSVSQFTHSVMSDSLWRHGLQHTRLSCPLPTPRIYSNSCPLSQWYHPTMPSSSVVSFSSHLQSFQASGSFQMSQFFALGGQSIGVSTSASVLPMNIQSWFPLRLIGLISFQSKGLSRVFNTIVQKHQFFRAQLSLWSNSHIHTWLLEKPYPLLDGPLLTK